MAANTVILFEAKCPSIYFADVVPKAASQALESTGCDRCSSCQSTISHPLKKKGRAIRHI